MFRVMIADDEPSVVESLVQSIQWEELGLQVIGTASTGKDALALVREQKAEIAVLDIRMPGFSGLELCEQLKREDEEIQVIVISGYAEFAYAEKAIRYGVIGYCLKPLDYVQVSRYLRKAVQNLNRINRIKIREDLLEVLEDASEKKIRNTLGSLGFEEEQYYVAVSIGERLQILENNGVALRLGCGQWGYLMRRPFDQLTRTELYKCMGWQGIGYFKTPVCAREIYSSLEECTVRAYQFFVEEKRCINADSGEMPDWLDVVRSEIQDGRWDNIPAILNQIPESGKNKFDVRTALQLHHMISSILTSSSLSEETDPYIYSIEELVAEYGTFCHMITQLAHMIEDMDRPDMAAAYNNSAFMKLIRYVNENYHGDISLSDAAHALYLNPNYVSQLFKKEAGVTFVRYVTQKRIEEAKDLLANTEASLTDIAITVGFHDYFYFIKTFKKITGLTPKQYRDQA
ncbi:MAG: response regulator [Clostridiales bacterium]|nr:response regulator [Clostridiales bacterium]MCC8106032.1 response regulator [Clostridiales bacterium]